MMPAMPPEEMLAEGFARQMQTLCAAGDETASSLLAKAARAVSLSTSAGHICLPLEEALGLEEPGLTEARERLLQTGLVTSGLSEPLLPLVLDAHGRLYLARYFDYERRLAAQLMTRAAAAPPAEGTDTETLDLLFPRAGDNDGADWQKVACAMAAGNRLTVIAGGPGTGKTTTVVKLLAALLAAEPGLRISLAAPTGKAAQRMREAIRRTAKELPEHLTAELPEEVHTVHRLLGVVAGARRFRHHAGNPLSLDVLVVDEASMLDLALATRLLEAVPEDARLIFLGDKDQLAAVEAGAVFHEICADPGLSDGRRLRLARLSGCEPAALRPPAAEYASPLTDCVVWLTESRRYRDDSGIGLLAKDINRGDARAVTDRLARGGHKDLEWLPDSGACPRPSTLARLASGFDAYCECVRRYGGDRAPVFDAFDRYRVLCAVRGTARGVEATNRAIADLFRENLNHPADDRRSAWYPGRPVSVLTNDYGLGLFNGDVGLTLPDAAGRPLVHFPLAGGTFQAVAPARLPPHETAFAMTVHKSQGSEFAEVAFVLPFQASRVLTRELVYTAVTRARSRMTLCGHLELFAQAATHRTHRNSGLLDRLREQAGNG